MTTELLGPAIAEGLHLRIISLNGLDHRLNAWVAGRLHLAGRHRQPIEAILGAQAQRPFEADGGPVLP